MSIYSTANYAGGTTYNINDVVRYPSNSNTFYYCLKNSVLGSTPSASSTDWGGISSWNGETKPKFIWKTNYGGVSVHEPNTLNIQFGDSYSQRITPDINADMLELQLNFELRNEKEAAAILHFLYARRAKESFLFTPAQPHDLEKLFVCRKFNDQYIYYGNHNLSCLFTEVAA